jgi:hypothetical protein
MLHFTKVLHVEDHGFLYFSFNCVLSKENKKCQVQVWTEGEQCHHFTMQEKNGQWKIIEGPLPPQWICKLEPELEKIVGEYQLKEPAVPSKFRLLELPEDPAKTGS